ncbi:uncharacterized protein LOC123710441 isoform X3 [Pieris brassicae]|uniref:uncharacterized protein LOC123710441 isoform X3 n=1 Tax=Pieris brassicae TaxID=7116 RepID=UPI001E66181F|nr:uncharacterized protein LOC123710441 isoform X3 [Pieris brassicae]
MYRFILFLSTSLASYDSEKILFCRNLECLYTGKRVCGVREEGDGFRLKIFEDECRLLRYGCNVTEDQAYGVINMEYCSNPLPNNSLNELHIKQLNDDNLKCDVNLICNNTEICAIAEEGEGYRVKRFPNRCELHKHNCKTNEKYTETEPFICESALSMDKQIRDINNREIQINDIKNLVIINGGMLGTDNVNESIDSFFAATHVFDLPVKEMDPYNTRRRLIKNAGPVKIFVPLIVIPKEKKNDTSHRPTLSTCYHTCPTKCPDTYAPVCGVAGIMAREPALMFKNHCFMDVAQCKMFWENKSSTSHSSCNP